MLFLGAHTPSGFEPEFTTYEKTEFKPVSSVSPGPVEHLGKEVVARVGCLVTDIDDFLLLPRRVKRPGDFSGPLDYLWGVMQTRLVTDDKVRAEMPDEAMARLAAEQGGKSFGEHVRRILERDLAEAKTFAPTEEFPYWERLYLFEQVPYEALPRFDSGKHARVATGLVPFECISTYLQDGDQEQGYPMDPAFRRAIGGFDTARI